MGWTREAFEAAQQRLSRNTNTPKTVVALPKPAAPPREPETGPVCRHTFVVIGDPVGKPRMTQRDKWMKRPAVLRYRAYADNIRAACGSLPEQIVGIFIIASIAMPASWSERKKTAFVDTLQRQKPDYDNISKSIGDALFDDDSCLGIGTCVKVWCREGQQKTTVSVLYLNKS